MANDHYERRLSPVTVELFDACLDVTGGDRAAAAMLTLAETLSSPKAPGQPAASKNELTVAEAAERLRCSTKTVYDLCREGRLPHRRLGASHGRIRIRAGDLDSYAPAERVFSPDISAKRRRYLGV